MSPGKMIITSAVLLAGLAGWTPAAHAQNNGFGNTGDVVVWPPSNCVNNQLNILTWDGITNVRCAPTPVCGNNQALSFNGYGFDCVNSLPPIVPPGGRSGP
jgi:hypothetical protein